MQPGSTAESRWAQGIEPCRTPTKGPTCALLSLSFELCTTDLQAGWHDERGGPTGPVRFPPLAVRPSPMATRLIAALVQKPSAKLDERKSTARACQSLRGSHLLSFDQACGPTGDSNPGIRHQARAAAPPSLDGRRSMFTVTFFVSRFFVIRCRRPWDADGSRKEVLRHM